MPVVADWLNEEGVEPAAAAAASVGRRQYAVTCQSLADALASGAAPSTQRNIISAAKVKTWQQSEAM